ncbi:MAG: hypothetical protein ABFR32_01825 [Bacteroidota bacterium]
MNSKLSKILSLVAGAIGIIAVFFLVRIIMVGDEAFDAINPDAASLQGSIISPYISFALALLYITAGFAVIFSIWNLIRHPKLLKKALLSVGVLAVLLLIAYFLAPGNAVTDATGTKILVEQGTVSKWSSTGIWYAVILGGIGLAFFLVDFVRGIVKN